MCEIKTGLSMNLDSCLNRIIFTYAVDSIYDMLQCGFKPREEDMKGIDIDKAIYHAALGDHLSLIDFLSIEGAKLKLEIDWDWGMAEAARSGRMDIVRLMIEKGASNWDWGMYEASYRGHMDIVRLMIEKGADDWDWGMTEAAGNGHMDIVRLMIEKGASNWDWGMTNAVRGGHMDIVRLMKEKGTGL